MSAQEIHGHCLCGAVTVRAEVSKPILRACHCDMCRQHTSSMLMTLGVDDDTLIFEGPVKLYRSSDWAERGFCEICGSTLFYGTIADKRRHPAAGLFKDATGAPLKLEFFTDNAAGYALEGDHRKMTTKETEALFAPRKGDA